MTGGLIGVWVKINQRTMFIDLLGNPLLRGLSKLRYGLDLYILIRYMGNQGNQCPLTQI